MRFICMVWLTSLLGLAAGCRRGQRRVSSDIRRKQTVSQVKNVQGVRSPANGQSSARLSFPAGTVISSDRETNKRYGKKCMGTDGRMSIPTNKEHFYRNLRDRYTNCTVVEGNLELTWLLDTNLDLSFLQHIREETGYVLISDVEVRTIVLPSLQIIWGRDLIKQYGKEEAFALLVIESKMHTLELPALRDIIQGSVGILNNYNLCHIKTIEWNEIISGAEAKYVYEYNFKGFPPRDCTPCHESCERGCWGEGKENCQRFSKINCAAQCNGGRCFGSNPQECCHLFCAGGCTGPKQSDCVACKNFYDDGVCKQECPPMQIYNPTKYKWEKNPEGKYAYGATCVNDCPENLLKDNGACVSACPPKKKAENGECVPCDGPCPESCTFSESQLQGNTVHSGNIDMFRNCTVIEGSLTILDTTFNGFQMIYPNYTFGPRFLHMDPAKLEVFSTLKEVTGFINIQAHHPRFTNLSAFRNLEIIGGRHLTEYFSALYIVKTSLKSLGLKSLQKIRSGAVAILENNDLCYAKKINWQRIMKSQQHRTLLQNNKSPEQCIMERNQCDDQCSGDGCWGPGNTQCLDCKNFQIGDECVGRCDDNLGYFQKPGDNKCKKCDVQCELTCTGEGANNCVKCKNIKDGPFCVDACPSSRYSNKYGECEDCHRNCDGGCKGGENNIGPRGCNSCDKAIVNLDLEVVQCLHESEQCPEGYFYEWVSLADKALCRPCHPLCKKCNGYGFHEDVCLECKGYMPSPTAAEITAGIERFSASPDLTRLNLKVLTRLGGDERVFKVWTIDGRIKFTMVKDKDAATGIAKFVYNVECVLDSIEEILVKAAAQKADFDAKNKGKGAKKPVKQTGKKPSTRQNSTLLKGPSPAVLTARNLNNSNEININEIDNILHQ